MITDKGHERLLPLHIESGAAGLAEVKLKSKLSAACCGGTVPVRQAGNLRQFPGGTF
ncbi:MAG: hypothetical protein ACP5I8_12870 [Phycisphaerae bacterium]